MSGLSGHLVGICEQGSQQHASLLTVCLYLSCRNPLSTLDPSVARGADDENTLGVEEDMVGTKGGNCTWAASEESSRTVSTAGQVDGPHKRHTHKLLESTRFGHIGVLAP